MAVPRVLVALVVLAAALALNAGAAHACSCEQRSSQTMLSENDGAFVGVVDDIGDEAQPGDPVAWTFTAVDWVKGRVQPGSLVVLSPRDSDACGFLDEPPGELAVFVRVVDNQLVGGLCDTAQAAELRELVGAGIGPGAVRDVSGFPLASPAVEAVLRDDAQAPPAAPTDRTWLGWLSGFVAIGAVLAACVGAVAVMRRRRLAKSYSDSSAR